MADPRRGIPSVDRLLSSAAFQALLADHPRDLVLSRLQCVLEEVRSSIARPHTERPAAVDADWIAQRVAASIRRLTARPLRPVINATGVVLHTNLGRAPLPAAAIDAMRDAAGDYVNLEYDLDTGSRGSRHIHCRDLLVHLTGAEDALVVNNNAAALVLALNTLSRGLEAVISRGELVEIGGAFRVPDIMSRSGAILREVGATNRTHADDYRAALSPRTGTLLKVHPSNFVMEGYTAEATVMELAGIATRGGIPLIHDIGSGLLAEADSLGLEGEPSPRDSLRAGADIVTMSGDKLLGGPQCGIILGSGHLVGRLRDNPLCRALRVDKFTLAALAATLRLYLDPALARREIPVLRMLSMTRAEIDDRATSFVRRLQDRGIHAETRPGRSAVGGGAAPGADLPTVLVVLQPDGMTVPELERRLRAGEYPVVARIAGDALVLDLRTVDAARDDALLEFIGAAFLPAP
jgi:L-seryl-tRNA(Ser) seleniumtransferase